MPDAAAAMRAEPRPSDHRADRSGEAADAAFRHEALLYSGAGDFVDLAAAFIREGLAAGEPILVVVASEKIRLLSEDLGDAAEHVDFRDMALVGANPARIIPAWHDFVAEHGAAGRSLRGIGEPISSERTPDVLVECQRHESLLNLAFSDSCAWWLLCPYDTAALPAPVLEEALRSHPFVWEGGTHRPSDHYEDLEAFSRPFDVPLPEPQVRAFEMTFAVKDLVRLRRAVADRAQAHGLERSRADDLVIAVNEIATNSLRHGGGRGLLRVWQEAGMLTCEIGDSGRIDQPLAGRRRPQAGQEGGFGMWLVHQCCDLVQVRQFPEGNVIRVHMSVTGRTRNSGATGITDDGPRRSMSRTAGGARRDR